MKRGINIIKFLILIILLIAIIAASSFLYLSISEFTAKPVELKSSQTQPSQSTTSNQLSFSGDSQFYPNMRFAERNLDYNMAESCSEDKKTKVKQAFSRIENETILLKFFENIQEQAEILIDCEETTTEEIPGEFYIAGEGGATSIINTSLFYVIQQGKILLYYKKSKCDNYNIELHELLHVLGFEHSENKNSILYNTTFCDQVLTLDIIKELQRLYSISELPELYFPNVSASKHGSYLDFNAEIRNQGIAEAKKAKLEIYADYGKEEKVETFDLGNINYGEGKYIEVKNLKLPSRKTEKIRLVILSGQELNMDNNEISLSLPS